MATLTNFDVTKDVVLTTDASPVGLGACLSHRIAEGKKTFLQPIAFASRSLTKAEKNYAQIEREGLAVVWAVKHFRQYLYCRHFTLQTDCSALVKIFGDKNDLGGCAIGRMDRWCVELLQYDFTAQHITGDKNKICDGLSRLPRPSSDSLLMEDIGHGLPGRTTKEFAMEGSANSQKVLVQCLSVLPIVDKGTPCYKSEEIANLAMHKFPLTANEVAKATREDPIYGRVLTAVKSGVLDRKDKTLSPFFSVWDNLTVDAGCLIFGSRVIIPTCQQARLLFELHHTHMGIVKMKSLAREHMWWPTLNKDIEAVAAKCDGCKRYRKKPAPAPLSHWPWACSPMERVHVDFAEYKGVQLLIMVDAYTKYIWAYLMGQDTTTPRLLRQLDSIFAERGLPTTIVSDNGPQFTSQKFGEHMKANGIKHVLTPPYHPASNGMAEVSVGIIKGHLKRMSVSSSTSLLQDAVTDILFQYRMTPNTSTGRTPFELMKKNDVQTPLSLLHPSIQRNNEARQQLKVSNRDNASASALRTFVIGEKVLVYNTLTKTNDIGEVVEKRGNNSYFVRIGERNRLVSVDHITKCVVPQNDEGCIIDSSDDSENECGAVNVDSSKDRLFLDDDSDDDSSDECEYQSEMANEEPNGTVEESEPYIIPHRRSREARKLQDSLSKGLVPHRTRSGLN